MAIEMTECRVCSMAMEAPFFSLGDMPAVNRFWRSAEEAAHEPKYPLALSRCARCGHVQLTHRLDPRDVFEDYIYFSSMSETVVRWGQQLAQRYVSELTLGPSDLVAELASNDGCILNAFRTQTRVVGVEPAKNIAQVANEQGIETLPLFFGRELGPELARSHGKAKLIIARNVLAHVPDLVGFLEGAKSLLADDGIVHVEVPSLQHMLHRLEFDTIYHEHLSYFSVATLQRLFARAGLVLFDVEELGLHGGSLIARGRHRGETNHSVAVAIAAERRAGLHMASTYERFAHAAHGLKTALPEFIHSLRRRGSVAAYGAAAKGVILTSYCGLGPDSLDWVADKSPHKQGLVMPGSHLNVVAPSQVFAEQPAFLLVLAWNFFEEIASQLAAYQRAGGQFVLPVPMPTVVSSGWRVAA